MHRYVEVKAHRRKVKRTLDHLRVYDGANGNTHLIESHFNDGSIESKEFRKHEENADALLHLANSMRMKGPSDEGRNQSEFAGGLEVPRDDYDEGEKA
jgi:hypothetical protein